MAEDIGLLNELLADSRPVTRGCAVCQWLEGRDDVADWDSAFQNDKVNGAAIGRALRKRGFPFKDKPVQNHRNERHRVA